MISCPKCGQGKYKVVDGARCIVCDNIVDLEKPKCRHREDGMVHCSTCDEPGHPSMNMDDEDFEGRKN